MFEKKLNHPPKEKEDCEIEIKKTNAGKRIKFRGKCSKEELQVFAKDNGIDTEVE